MLPSMAARGPSRWLTREVGELKPCRAQAAILMVLFEQQADVQEFQPGFEASFTKDMESNLLFFRVVEWVPLVRDRT